MALAKEKYESAVGIIRWKADVPLLYMIKVDAKAGYRDAKDDEDLDKDIDYKFTDSRIRLDHKIGKDYRVYNEASYYKKDYKQYGQNDNEGFELVEGWKLKPINTKSSALAFDVTLNYKKFNYITQNDLDFEKVGASFKATLNQKKDWKTYLGVGYAKRNQRDNTKDRNDYEFLSVIEKNLVSNSLGLNLDGRYVNREYKNAGDKSLYSVTIEVICKI